MIDNNQYNKWLFKELGEVSTIKSGGTPSRAIKEYWNGDIPWVKISDISKEYVDKTDEFITVEGLKNSSTNIFPKGTILFTIFATIGKVGILDIDATTNQAIAGITPNSEIVNSKFLTYSLRELALSLENQGKGVAQKNINLSILKSTKIPLPPLPEQKRIVAKLDSIFSHLELAKQGLVKIPVLLKQFRQAVLTQGVTGKLTEQWRNGKELEDWTSVSSSKIFEFITSGSRGWAQYYDNSGDQLFVRITNMNYGTFKLDLRPEKLQFLKLANTTEGKRTLLKSRDILISITADVGMISLVEGDFKYEGYVNQHVCLARPIKAINEKFLVYFLMSENGFGQFKKMKRGATKSGLTLGDIKKLNIEFPPLIEQAEIVSHIEVLLTKADAIEAQYKKLKEQIDQLPQAILAKAFKGDLAEQKQSDGLSETSLKNIKALKAEL